MNHIVKSYDRDLEEVLGEVTAMGRLVREQLVKAADALEKLDADEARSVMTRDAEVNGYEVRRREDRIRLRPPPACRPRPAHAHRHEPRLRRLRAHG